MILDPTIIAVSIGSLTTILVTILTLRQSKINTHKTEALETKANENAVTTAEIHKLTNSTMSELKAELKDAKEHIKAINESNKVMQSLIMTFMERDSRPPAVIAAVIAPPSVVTSPEPVAHVEKLDEIAETGADTSSRVKRIETEVVKVKDELESKIEDK